MKKKKKINKKGISPMVATILLIAFVVAIILLILLWGKNYIEELAEKRGLLAEKKQECTKLKLDVVKACRQGSPEDPGVHVTIANIVLRNEVDIPIHKFIFTAGDSEPIEKYGTEWKLGGLETKSYPNLEFTPAGINYIDVIPHLRVALGHYVPCSDQKIRVKLTGYC